MRIVKISKKIVLSLILILVGISITGVGTYFYYQYNQLKNNPNLKNEKDTLSLIENIGKMIYLPTDDEPSIATVTNTEELKDQSFFKNAKNEDVLIIYPKSRKTILYRPSENKIIDFTFIATNQKTEDEPLPTAIPSPVALESTESSSIIGVETTIPNL